MNEANTEATWDKVPNSEWLNEWIGLEPKWIVAPIKEATTCKPCESARWEWDDIQTWKPNLSKCEGYRTWQYWEEDNEV